MSSAIITRPVITVSTDYPGYHNVIVGDDAVVGVHFNSALAIARLVLTGVALYDAERDVLGVDFEGPTCSICDGVGHGYVGGAPCPLEMRGEEGCPWWAQ